MTNPEIFEDKALLSWVTVIVELPVPTRLMVRPGTRSVMVLLDLLTVVPLMVSDPATASSLVNARPVKSLPADRVMVAAVSVVLTIRI